jgi:hypothetical protein
VAEKSSWMNSAATDLEGFSRWLTKLFRAGVVTGWTVSQKSGGADMSVDIAAGDGVPMTTDTAPWDWSTTKKNVAIGAASANNRRDLIVAYTDLSVTNPSTSTPNNPAALKFIVVQGTPAISPSDPNDAAIRATAVGATNPYLILARVSLTSSTTQITNAQITSLITPIAFNVQRFWGGGSNTLGHQVPNAADAYFALTSRSDGRPNAGSFSNPYVFRATSNAFTTPVGSNFTKVPLAAEQFDPSNSFDNVTNYRYTAQVAGPHQFDGIVRTAVIGASRRIIACLYKNGTLYTSGGDNTRSSDYIGITVSDLIHLAVGEYVELFVYSSDAQNFDTSSKLSGFLVSPD